MKPILLVFAAFAATLVQAQIGVSVELTNATENRAEVSIEIQNGLGKDVRDARAWVFLFDADGKFVGQQAQWLGGGGIEEQEPSANAQEPDAPLMADGDQKTFSMGVKTQARPIRAEITFSRIILSDGSLVNIQRDVKPLETPTGAQP